MLGCPEDGLLSWLTDDLALAYDCSKNANQHGGHKEADVVRMTRLFAEFSGSSLILKKGLLAQDKAMIHTSCRSESSYYCLVVLDNP